MRACVRMCVRAVDCMRDCVGVSVCIHTNVRFKKVRCHIKCNFTSAPVCVCGVCVCVRVWGVCMCVCLCIF